MDITQLKYFIVTAEERSVSRAAERLHMSQPPLTRQIHALEEQLGVTLFTRRPHGVELTDAGRSLLDHALSIKTQVEQATEHLRRVSNGQEGRLDLGVFGSAVLSTIPQLLSHYSSQYPKVRLSIHFASRGEQIEALLRERVLLAFDRHRTDTPEILSELVTRERLLVALPQGHVAARKSAASLDDLRNSQFIGELDPCIYPACRALFERHRFQPLYGQRAADMISAVAMVAGGFGVAIVPESLLNLQFPNVVYRRLEEAVDCCVDVYCIYRKSESSPLLEPLLQCIRTYGSQPDSPYRLESLYP